MPRGIAAPAAASNSFAWYSWIFIAGSSGLNDFFFIQRVCRRKEGGGQLHFKSLHGVLYRCTAKHHAEVKLAMTESAQLLRDLVSRPSVNPMGRTNLPASHVYEHRVTAYLEDFFRGLGVPYERQPV